MKHNTISFQILCTLTLFSFGLQIFTPLNAIAGDGTWQSGRVSSENLVREFAAQEAVNPVLSAAVTAIERNLSGVPENQKNRFDHIVDTALRKYPSVTKEDLWRVVSTWKQLPVEQKAFIEFPTLVAMSRDKNYPKNLLTPASGENLMQDSPVLFAVSPKEFVPGQTQEVIIVGKNLKADTKIDFGEGVQIARRTPQLVGSYQMTLWVTVANDAPLGERKISISNTLLTPRRKLSVSVKKPSLKPVNFVSGWSYFKLDKQTELLTWNGMRADGSPEFPFIFGKKGQMVTSNSSNWHLQWTNNAPQAKKAQWQMSYFPMRQEMQNWQKPAGLIGYGTIKSAPQLGKSKRLDINLTPVVTRSVGASPYSADTPLRIQPKKPVITKPRVKVQPGRVTIKPSTAKPIKSSLKEIAPSVVLAQNTKRTFYMRLVPLDGRGSIAGLPSQSVEIVYNPVPPKSEIQVYFASTETVSCQAPQARFKGYEPIRMPRTESQYWYIIVKDPGGQFLKTMGWKVGDHIFLPPKSESKDAWDYIEEGFGAVVGLVGDVVNAISTAWNEIKGATVGTFVNFLKSVQIGCPGWCENALKMGLDAGLVAVGIPPSIPNFNELQNIGADYIAETIATEVIAASPVPLPKEQIKNAAKAALNEMRKQVDNSASGGFWLMHDYTADLRPAYIVIQAYNSGNKPTSSGSVWLSETMRVYKSDRSVAVPALQPGETLDIPVFLEPDLDLPDGIPTSYFPYDKWGERYNGSANFRIGSGCGCPEATPYPYNLNDPTQHIILCDPQGGSGDVKLIKAREKWGNP